MQCNSSDIDPATQGWDLPKLSGRRLGNPLPTIANYTPCSPFGIYGLIFFHILTLFKGLGDYGWPVCILINVRGGELWIEYRLSTGFWGKDPMNDHLVSVFRSDSDPNEIPEELWGSGTLQWAGLLPRAWVQEGSGGGEQQAGRFAGMDTSRGASSSTWWKLLVEMDGTAGWFLMWPGP